VLLASIEPSLWALQSGQDGNEPAALPVGRPRVRIDLMAPPAVATGTPEL